jgi:hypothetical protein
LNQLGGRADVYLDGRKHMVGTADAYIVPNTHDNVLWQAYGLKPGPHTLRIVTTPEKDPRSTATEITLQSAIVYGPTVAAAAPSLRSGGRPACRRGGRLAPRNPRFKVREQVICEQGASHASHRLAQPFETRGASSPSPSGRRPG